ncbi:neuronal acetylcholine receptor subunit alpha-10-like isoform X2 [Lytechinus variegatus]|uniref:neuronal acetylcholine receptor subunit alpha-10-like isoform X2 n=1 Tax=Lytechinus variegatus TaxID=7654 RepID=UPI001BB1143E|nr:neuronal acetylcholine receptor subunit alpha-10-like isoform X2 [Lytechinus variegatus]
MRICIVIILLLLFSFNSLEATKGNNWRMLPYHDYHSAQVYLVNHYLVNDSRYSKYVRPVNTEDAITHVTLSFHLGTIIDLDESSQTLTAHIGLSMNWADKYLTWDPREYYDVEHLRMPSDEVWIPDITLANSAERARLMESTVVRIQHDGEVEWSALIIVKTFCKIDFTFFPFDEQECLMTFRPWTHLHNHVLMRSHAPEKTDEDNGEWKVAKIQTEATMEYLDHGNFSKIDVTIHLARRPLFYIMNMINPCVIIYALTLLSFCLPGESGEKIALNVTILLSLTVFMLLTSEMMPPSADTIPVIAQFYAATIVLVSISILFAVISLNFFHRPPDAHRAPLWLRKLFFIHLTPILYPWRMSCAKNGEGADLRRIMDCNGDVVGPIKVATYQSHQTPSSPKLLPAATRRLAKHHESCGITDTNFNGRPLDNVNGVAANHANNPVTTITCTSCNGAIKRQLGNISEDLHSMIEDRQMEEEKESIITEWKKMAHVFDRLGLVLFILATVILAIILGNRLGEEPTDV